MGDWSVGDGVQSQDGLIRVWTASHKGQVLLCAVTWTPKYPTQVQKQIRL